MIPIPTLSPTAWLKIGAAVVIIGAAVWFRAEFVHRGEQVEQLKDAAKTYETAVGQYETANTQWARADQLRRDALARERAERQRVQAQAQAIAAQARAAAAAADERARQWRDRFNTRPQGCAAALAALDSACPTLRGY